MGWYFTNDSTRADQIRELTENIDRVAWADGTRSQRITLAKTYKGAPWKGTLYAVQENITTPPVGPPTVERYIGVYLMQYDRASRGWGYKPIACCSGPVEDGCPVKYLDMSPAHDFPLRKDGSYPEQWCREWHAACRARAARGQSQRAIAKALSPGERVRAAGFPEPFTVVANDGRRITVSGNGYHQARLKASQIEVTA